MMLAYQGTTARYESTWNSKWYLRYKGVSKIFRAIFGFMGRIKQCVPNELAAPLGLELLA